MRGKRIFTPERQAELLYGVFEILGHHPHGITNREVVKRMRRQYPPSPLELTSSNTREDEYEHELQRLTSAVSTAPSGLGVDGWVDKSNRSLGWRITSSGHHALEAHPDPQQFFAASGIGG